MNTHTEAIHGQTHRDHVEAIHGAYTHRTQTVTTWIRQSMETYSNLHSNMTALKAMTSSHRPTASTRRRELYLPGFTPTDGTSVKGSPRQLPHGLHTVPAQLHSTPGASEWEWEVERRHAQSDAQGLQSVPATLNEHFLSVGRLHP